MADTLTQLIAKVQAILGDGGTLFTTATCTAAIRQALHEYNRAAPIHAADLITGDNDQYIYELTDYDTNAVKIFDILLQGDDQNQIDTPIDFDQYNEDERLFFRLRQPVTTSDTLIVRYTKLHTISGLDSATESTAPAWDDQILVDGGAYFAILTRATARVESINLSKDQSDNYREIMTHFRTAFNLGLANIGQRKRVPVAEPDTRAWNDSYHNWGQ